MIFTTPNFLSNYDTFPQDFGVFYSVIRNVNPIIFCTNNRKYKRNLGFGESAIRICWRYSFYKQRHHSSNSTCHF